MIDYLNKMRQIADQLAMADAPISTTDLILHVLNGLDNDCNGVVSVIVNMADSHDVSWVTVQSQLLAHEGRLEALNQISNLSLQPSVNYAQGPRAPSSPARGSWRGSRAFFGGRRGRGRNSGGGNRPFCHLCERHRHLVANCFHRFDRSFQPQTHSPQFAQFANAPQAFHAQSHFSPSSSQFSPSPFAQPQSVADPAWYIDSGANYHVTPHSERLDHVDSLGNPVHLHTCTGDITRVVGIGSGSLSLPHSNLSLKDVLVVPNATKSLLSVQRLTADNPVEVLFSGDEYVVKDKVSGTQLVKGRTNQGLYQVPTRMKVAEIHHAPAAVPQVHSATVVKKVSPPKILTDADILLWHYRLGHPSDRVLNQILKQCNFRFHSLKHVCEACQFGKSKKLPFSKSLSHASSPFELVHTDLWGPSPLQSVHGNRYYILFLDDFSRYTWIFPLKIKGESVNAFNLFKTQVETQFNSRIKALQCDNGT